MPVNILMPALSPTMEEGTIVKWLVREGEKVASGAVLAEIETDKATMEFEAADDGVLGKIVVPEGTEGVKVNDVIAVLLEEGEDPGSIDGSTPPTDAAPAARPATETAQVPKTEAPAAGVPAPRKSGERIFASPLARRIAAERGIDLASVTGSGPNGRIVKADVESRQPDTAPQPGVAEVPAPKERPASPAPDADAIRRLFADREYEEITLDGMRKTIAARLSEAKQTIPHFYLRREIRLDPLLALRAEMNGLLAARGVKLSVNDFVIKACAVALQAVPGCNAVWAGDRILRLKPSDVAVAVAVEGGLFTPVIRDAETKSLSTLSMEMKDLAARARTRKLAPHEYQGGTFAISNLGMMGVESFDAVINPPHGSILAVGAGVSKPIVAADGKVEVATVVSVTLSVDHRVIDGALGAEFLAVLKENLEQPMAMLA